MCGVPAENRGTMFRKSQCSRAGTSIGLVRGSASTVTMSTFGLRGSQRRHVDGEAVLHVRLEHPLVGLVDLLDRDHLDIGSDVVLSAEVEHLLRLGNAADIGAG